MIPTTADAYDLLHQGSLALACMEENGFCIDMDYLQRTTHEVTVRIKEFERELQADKLWREWRKRYGEKASLGSDTQLTELLFNVLKLPYPEGDEWRTKTGRYKADEETIGAVDLPFTKTWQRYKKQKRLLGTYLNGISREVVNGRVHASYNLHTVETYRSSCSDPNVQNQYKRDPEMMKILRRCYVASPGCVLAEIDYSGIEVRVAACYNHDPSLIKYIKDPTTDMHRDTAADLFLLPVEFLIEHKDWTKKTVRDWAKNRFVFPQFYGSVYFQCAPSLWEGVCNPAVKVPGTDLTVKQHLKAKGIRTLGACKPAKQGENEPEEGTFEHHVREVERSFWNQRFKVYTEWKNRWHEAYLKKGYYDTLTGFRMAGHYKRNEVLNGGIQGDAFHCLLWSIIKSQRLFDKRKLKAKLIAEIHDSVILDVPVGEVQEVLTLAHKIMTVDLPKAWEWLIVPLEVECELTDVEGSWADQSRWENRNGIWQPG